MQFIISFSALLLALVMGSMPAHAFTQKETARYFNGPTVSSVTDTTAVVSLSTIINSELTEEEKKGVYFEYS